jgi:hypothetical protein
VRIEEGGKPDVVFLSYEEPNADANFARLLEFAPRAKRVHHVEGIFNAYQAALALAATPYFFIVDGDSWILDGFEFAAPANVSGAAIWMWLSRNAVNGLEHLNGAVKLLSREAISSMRPGALDFSVSMRGRRLEVRRVASETRFNTSPFLAWRSGFRECAKLASGFVNHPTVPHLIRTWQTVGANKPNGNWCMLGSRMGADFGTRFAGTDRLRSINDMGWMKAVFERVQSRVASTGSQVG